MFDIKTEAVSPAASKEEEEDEDEVDWGRGRSAWYESHDWKSKQKIRKLKTPNKTIPWSWADFSQEEEDPLNSSLTPMDWLPRLNAKAGMVEVGCFLHYRIRRVTLTKALNFPIHCVFGKVFLRGKRLFTWRVLERLDILSSMKWLIKRKAFVVGIIISYKICFTDTVNNPIVTRQLLVLLTRQ